MNTQYDLVAQPLLKALEVGLIMEERDDLGGQLGVLITLTRQWRGKHNKIRTRELNGLEQSSAAPTVPAAMDGCLVDLGMV
jgi:hypothetical protein